jgi:hypothetical protein
MMRGQASHSTINPDEAKTQATRPINIHRANRTLDPRSRFNQPNARRRPRYRLIRD